MGQIDWIILIGTLVSIVLYGTYKARGSKNVTDYLKGGSDSRWWTIGLSVMATQASAITFLSTPGQAFHDGMGFVLQWSLSALYLFLFITGSMFLPPMNI